VLARARQPVAWKRPKRDSLTALWSPVGDIVAQKKDVDTAALVRLLEHTIEANVL
jgi:hypothetical protein